MLVNITCYWKFTDINNNAHIQVSRRANLDRDMENEEITEADDEPEAAFRLRTPNITRLISYNCKTDK